MDFPKELLKYIFAHLDKETLKKCLLLSDEIRELIIRTPELMRKLEVILFNENWKEKLKFVDSHGYFIRSLRVDDVSFTSVNEMKDILRKTPNLEKLVMYNCYIETEEDRRARMGIEDAIINNENNNDVIEAIAVQRQEGSPEENSKPNEENDEPVDMLHLVHLHLESTNIAEALVKSFSKCNKLKYLKMTFYYQEPVTTFTEFICQQRNLKDLSMMGWSDMIFKCLFKDDIRELVQFKLQKLYLECELSFHSNFSKFFRAQGEFLKELDLCCYNMDFHYYRTIFNHFQCLEKLVIPTDYCITEGRVASVKDCRVPSVKEIELVGMMEDYVIFKTFINIFPNISILKCENLLFFSMHNLEKFEKLERIQVDNFRCETMMNVKLPSLKVFNIVMLYPCITENVWEKFAENCFNIEEITIDEIGHFRFTDSIKSVYSAIINVLHKFKNLKICKILCNIDETTINADQDENHHNEPEEHPFFKVNLNVAKKTIQLSRYFANHCEELVLILQNVYKDCDIEL